MSDDSNETGNTEAVIPAELRGSSQAEPGGGQTDPVGGIPPGDALDGGPAAARILRGLRQCRTIRHRVPGSTTDTRST